MAIGSREGAGNPQELHGLPSLQQELDEFWRKTLEDIESTMDFNSNILPMSYVANIMRDNQGSFMVTSDTPPVLTKLMEIFIQELVVRAWMCAKSHERSTILESDIYEAINSVESYDFLSDVVQRPGSNHDQASMSNNVPQLQQVPMESHFLAATSALTENGPTEDNLAPAINVQPDPLESKNDEDIDMSTTSSGSTEETN